MGNDLSPKETWGRVVTVRDPDRFTTTGFDDVPITVRRAR
jgi:hypothetical protein